MCPLDFQLFNFWGSLLNLSRTNSGIRLHVFAYPVKQYTGLSSFVTIYCMNFVIFLCYDTLKLFSLSFMPLLAPHPDDATGLAYSNSDW